MSEQNATINDAPHGRPTKYRPGYCKVAREMCERGATNADLAAHFGVALSTIWLWQTTHTEFFESCKLGKAVADERVKQSFYMRAVGYEYDAVKVMQSEGTPVYAPYREHVPADVTAGKFWLMNRCSGEFKDTQHLNHDTPADSPLAELARQLAGTALRPREGEPPAAPATPDMNSREEP